MLGPFYSDKLDYRSAAGIFGILQVLLGYFENLKEKKDLKKIYVDQQKNDFQIGDISRQIFIRFPKYDPFQCFFPLHL